MANPLDFAYYTLQARPDQPHRYDQQSAFLESQHPGVTFLLGGNGAGTSTLALLKAVEFVMTTPPPRRDTPFWIIAESYEQTMNVCWKEKMHQFGLLPPSEVEWERIRWYKPNNDWPYAVPLRPWPGRPGKNWQFVFKSYDQGRAKMQGEAIGGFLFVEQFPWGLLEEVIRGTREYDFVGNKLAEFTPVNPALSIELQEMEEDGKLPPGWAIYRANTECAVEAGHVTQQWFDQFFAIIPEQMRGVRMKGLWGGFEGAIYPEFDKAIHCLPADWDITPACHHRRMIDWGSGVDNAFCCLFGCRNAVGQWFIYDEYYSNNTLYTTINHLKAVSDMHPWPMNNPYYGVSWADPSSLDRLRIASKLSDYAPGYDSISVQGAANSVEEGIEHVKWLLMPDHALALEDDRPQPRLFILKERCPNLVRQMTTYRRMKGNKNGLNPRDAVDAPLKADDHAVDALRYGVFSEASISGISPSTIARLHNPQQHGVQVNSGRLKYRRGASRNGSSNGSHNGNGKH